MSIVDLPSLVDVRHPPVEKIGKQLERNARSIARLMARRDRALKQADQLEGELVQARAYLRALIREAQLPRPLPVQPDTTDEP